MLPPNNEAQAVAGWLMVLDEIGQKLGEAQAIDPEAKIPAFPPVADAPPKTFDEGLDNLQSRLDRCDADAAAIAAGLQSESGALDTYLDNLRATQRKLAEWASGAV
jgi:hypothetical protein